MKRTFALSVAAVALSAMSLTTLDALAAPGGGTPRTEMPRSEPSGPNKKKEQARESDFQKAEYLIKGEKYDEAIPLLQNVVADNPRDADAWNYLGFASRKIGKLDEALGYYDKALKISPNHKGANEYLGELYLMMKNLPKAEEQLAKLKAICPTGCEELEDLEADIADFKSGNPG